MVTVWVSASFTYYLITSELKYLKGDIFINTLVSGGSEVVAYLTSGMMAK